MRSNVENLIIDLEMLVVLARFKPPKRFSKFVYRLSTRVFEYHAYIDPAKLAKRLREYLWAFKRIHSDLKNTDHYSETTQKFLSELRGNLNEFCEKFESILKRFENDVSNV